MAFPDVLALLCESMSAELGVRTVTDLPPDFTPPIIQVVTIDDIPRDKPFNGRHLRTTVSVDVLYFGLKSGPDPLADLRALAERGSDWLNNWRADGIVVDERTRPVRRPDYNPKVLRYGGVVDFLCKPL